jgi:transmembrane sensor
MKEQLISDSLGEAIRGYYSNHLTQQQADELMAWIGENEENIKYFRELGQIWYASSQLSTKESDAEKGWLALQDKIADNDIRPLPKKQVKINVSVLYKAAATILLMAALGVGSIFIFRHPEAKSSAAYFEALAPKGSRSFIKLSDGSTVWLNSGTRLRYQSDFGKSGRELFLEGEAYFEVAKNKDLPFRVKTSDVCITALGTAFNVKAYNDESIIETTLERGSVRIESLHDSNKQHRIASICLKPNQKAIFVKSSRNLTVNDPVTKTETVSNNMPVRLKPIEVKVDTLVDTKLSTSWKDSKWIFKSEKLIKLAPILERRYDVTITFRDSVLRNYAFTGTLKEESLEQVLQAMCLAAPVRYEIRHNQVTFFEDKKQKGKYKKIIKSN